MMNNLSVVKIKIRNQLTSRKVSVFKNQQKRMLQSLLPGDHMIIDTVTGKEVLENIQLEAEAGLPRPWLTIDSPRDYHISVSQETGQNKWELVFNNSGLLEGEIETSGPQLVKDEGGTVEAGPSEPVSVTLGHDEPPVPEPVTYQAQAVFCISTTAAVAALIAPFIYNVSPIAWGVALGVTVISAVFSGIKVLKNRKANIEPNQLQ